jgi:hypothetical protein
MIEKKRNTKPIVDLLVTTFEILENSENNREKNNHWGEKPTFISKAVANIAGSL